MTSLPTVGRRAWSDPGRGRTSQGLPASARGPAWAGDPGGADNQDVGLSACEGTRGVKAGSRLLAGAAAGRREGVESSLEDQVKTGSLRCVWPRPLGAREHRAPSFSGRCGSLSCSRCPALGLPSPRQPSLPGTRGGHPSRSSRHRPWDSRALPALAGTWHTGPKPHL